jgi:hypothetical protein
VRIVNLIIVSVFVSCAQDPAPDPPVPEIFVQPTVVGELAMPERSFALPSDWVGSSHIYVAHHPDLGTLVGGPTGLFRLQADALVSVHDGEQIPEVDEGAVYGLSVTDEFVWVASASGLSVYDGLLKASPVNDELPTGAVRAIVRVGDSVWIALEEGLWTFDGTQLGQLAQIPGVYQMIAGSHQTVSVTTVSGQSLLLKTTEAGVMQHDLSGQGLLRDVVPVASDRLFALEGGALKARVPHSQGEWIWRRTALASEDGAEPVSRAWTLSATSAGDGVWIATADALSSWVGDQIETLPMPLGLNSVLRIHPTSDGRVWLVGTERLVRLGGDGQPPPTYCDDIEPYYQTNCEHCHNATPSSQAVDLSGHTAWSQRYDSIFALVQAGAMPKDADGRVDGGALYMLQRWQEGGMIECDTP